MSRKLLALIVTLALTAGLAPLVPAPAEAQGFFEMLFGGPRYRPPPRSIGEAPPGVRTIGEPTVPVVEVEPKNEDALKVLVIGDFLAASLAAGLDQTFAREPSIAVLDRTSGSSGLVRDDHHDWNDAIVPLLNDIQPDFVVVMIGTNDRQQIRLPDRRLEPRSDEWVSLYKARINELAGTLSTYARPFFWVSAPPVSSPSMAEDLAYFNGFYKAEVEAAGGQFIDVWNGFVDEDGRFTRSGPDVEGQVRTLRSSDGMNFTRVGRYKLAHYVDREIRRTGALGGDTGSLLASTTAGDRIEIGPDGERIWVGPVLSLSGPPVGAPGYLVGGPDEVATPDAESPRFRLVEKGEAPPSVTGRVDDFSWPSPRHTVATVALEVERPETFADIREGVPIPPRKPE
jgi:hypothetical protein